MKVAIGSDLKGYELKEHIKEYLNSLGYEIQDMTLEKELDFFDVTCKIAKAIQEKKVDRGIVIDEYGVGSFIVANKHKGIICANVFDEHSAKMTRRHNNSTMITIGSGIVGVRLAEKIAEIFLASEYDGGRHQIRVDMLNKLW
ncbi:galactose-6-phosphate isomerase subunit LacA [Clostridium sp. D2Q-14]|uniref:galactose-6-phosphate isomerase subunit LacA n=1 Tax=Anaeromonas gelatinilytica TaxID=2683194 RepID=UPI00193C7C7E|nr:galactose-6-phosphate isomerase subunit LacA [Anaeromonas gelatinilytica]MBS4535756.1 galactose-6-phosphate isomerase subunit LacA [Anaeromonas gelatinilytica]